MPNATGMDVARHRAFARETEERRAELDALGRRTRRGLRRLFPPTPAEVREASSTLGVVVKDMVHAEAPGLGCTVRFRSATDALEITFRRHRDLEAHIRGFDRRGEPANPITVNGNDVAADAQAITERVLSTLYQEG